MASMTKDEVKRLRKKLGWTQQKLADELGVTQTSVARWEIGMNQIEEPTARLLKLLVKLETKPRRRNDGR
jgi:transcriptional regulator with XRE-family HTH domain